MGVTEAATSLPHRAADRLDVRAVVVVVACCASWGLNQVAIKIASAGIAPVLQAGLRSLLACALVFAWAAMRGVRLFERDGTLWAGIGAGVLFALEFLTLYTGLSHTTASRAVILLYASPFVVAFGAHYLIPGDRLSIAKIVGLTAALAGVA
ncbi:MAG: EamA family transporter, partial [Hyphomicrobiaceae bacterium]